MSLLRIVVVVVVECSVFFAFLAVVFAGTIANGLTRRKYGKMEKIAVEWN